MNAHAMSEAIILAGGRGARLGGVDKPMITVGGQTLLGYAVTAAAQSSRLVVVGSPRPGFEHLEWTRERPPGGGPAAGVIAGLRALGDPATAPPWVLLLAADQPGVVPAVAALLRAAATAREETEALCPYTRDGRPQWLLAAYRREMLQARCAPLGSGHGVPVGRMLAGIHLTEVPEANDHGGDIDTWEDHRAWVQRLEP